MLHLGSWCIRYDVFNGDVLKCSLLIELAFLSSLSPNCFGVAMSSGLSEI